jgi:DNA-binding transcriptional LysR family regulator
VHSTRHLALVHALAEHRNFGRAAVALRVSQPALTRSLKHLEDTLGVPLFDRAGVTPTIFGEIVLRHGRPVLAGFAELTREIALMKGLEIGSLAVAMGAYAADISGHEAAALLSRRHPNLSLDLRVTDWTRARDAVLAGDADLALADIRDVSENPDFVTDPVRSGAVTFFCRADHPLVRRTVAGLGDLMGYPWVGTSFPAGMSGSMPKEERPCGSIDRATGRFLPRILVESFASAKRIVRAGDALSAALPFQIEAEIASGDLVLLPNVLPFVGLNYGFITKRGRAMSPAAKAFMSAVREVERRISDRPGSANAARAASLVSSTTD